MQNPFDTVRCSFYNDCSTLQCADAAVVTLLRVMAANFTGGFEAGDNPYKYCLLRIAEHDSTSEFFRKLKKDWNSRLNRV